MKRFTLALFVAGVSLALFAIDLPGPAAVPASQACGWGQGGGESFAPQRQDNGKAYAYRPALTKEQAQKLIEQHVTRLNNTLTVGPVTDAGELFEAEIYSKDNEVVQVLGVDKNTGRLVLIN